MADRAIANRLHRSGAIDANVEFPTRHAEVLKDRSSSQGKRLYAICPDDGFSVCEGEPIYTPKRHKGNHYTSVDSVRNPISCMSSLNGFSGVGDKIHSVKRSNTANLVEAVKGHEKLRDTFFKEIHPSGISVSKWSYPRVGHQQDQYVATLGGMNTIYCDTDCQAGDTLVVDMPFPTEAEYMKLVDKAAPGSKESNCWGFVECVPKKGCPREKITLVVRPLPDLPFGGNTADERRDRQAIMMMRSNFARRGQIIGKCTRGAKKGERVDLCLQANAIGGSVNMGDMYALMETFS